jgi:hypothetical protein
MVPHQLQRCTAEESDEREEERMIEVNVERGEGQKSSRVGERHI